jgi:hypothetical protein
MSHSQDGPSFVHEDTNVAKIAERMPAGIYFPQTIGLFILQMLMALLIDDITIIFGFFAAISESTINFILPGLFYLISHKVVKKRPNFFGVIGSYLYVCIGVGLFFIANYNNYQKLRA